MFHHTLKAPTSDPRSPDSIVKSSFLAAGAHGIRPSRGSCESQAPKHGQRETGHICRAPRQFTPHSARHVQTLHMPGYLRRLSGLSHLRCLAALLGVALASNASASDAAVGRDSSAKVRARVVELVNAARADARKC